MADNVTTTNVVTFTSDNWTGDPKGASQVPISKLMWGGRDVTYTLVDDVTGFRFPVKVGDPLPAGTNAIGGVTQSGVWSVGISGSVSLPTNASQETGGNLATIAANTNGAAKDSSLTTIDTDIKATQPRNISQFGGSVVVTGTGVSGVGIPRVTVASDSVVGVSGSVAVTGTFFQATQPVSGTFFQATQPVSATSLPLPSNAAQETGGNLATIAGAIVSQGTALGAIKELMAAGSVTTNAPSYTTGQIDPLSLTTGGGLRIDLKDTVANTNNINVNLAASAATVTVSGTVTGNQGTANSAANAWPTKLTDGTNTTAVKAASTAAAATDPSAVVQLSPNQPQLTTALNIQGGKTNNNAAPGATNIGSLPALANAALPTWTEGDQVTQSVDLNGGLRAVIRPPVILGAYRLAAQTAGYTALGAAAILYSFRWSDATKVCAITRVRIMVNTTTAATAAGMIDRELVIVRGFTAGDTGGTAVTLTGNNQKMRTSQATTVVGGIQILSGGALASTTGTPDAQAIGLVAKQGGATEPVGQTIAPEDLFLYNAGQNYPIFLVQNEGFRIRIPTAMPTTIVMRTTVIVEWQEIAAAGQF